MITAPPCRQPEREFGQIAASWLRIAGIRHDGRCRLAVAGCLDSTIVGTALTECPKRFQRKDNRAVAPRCRARHGLEITIPALRALKNRAPASSDHGDHVEDQPDHQAEKKKTSPQGPADPASPRPRPNRPPAHHAAAIWSLTRRLARWAMVGSTLGADAADDAAGLVLVLIGLSGHGLPSGGPRTFLSASPAMATAVRNSPWGKPALAVAGGLRRWVLKFNKFMEGRWSVDIRQGPRRERRR